MIDINVEQFLASLPKVGLGMLGIFIVTALIILTVVALNFFTRPKKEASESDGAVTKQRTKKLGTSIVALFVLIVVAVAIALIYIATKN